MSLFSTLRRRLPGTPVPSVQPEPPSPEPEATPAQEPERADYDVAAIEPLIDETYYFNRYPSARQEANTAAEHYANIGWRRGYDPTPWFSSLGYLQINEDVAGVQMAPFVHYALFGRREGRSIAPTADVVQPRAKRSLPLSPVSPDLRALRAREENNWSVHIGPYTQRRLEMIERQR